MGGNYSKNNPLNIDMFQNHTKVSKNNQEQLLELFNREYELFLDNHLHENNG